MRAVITLIRGGEPVLDLGWFDIDADTGATTASLGHIIPGLAEVAHEANESRHGGYVEHWRPPLQRILDWAAQQGVEVELIDEPPPWPPLPPGCVGSPLA